VQALARIDEGDFCMAKTPEIRVDASKLAELVRERGARPSPPSNPFVDAIRRGKSAFDAGAKPGDQASCPTHEGSKFVAFTGKGLICAVCAKEHGVK
jgi:hypothetical protein